jgi:hypothetical protein
MGICESNSQKKIVEHINEYLNFETAREEIRDKRDENIYEVKAKLWEFKKVNDRLTTKNLISKYLFFTPNGKFTSSVSQSMFSDLIIEGWINPKNLYIILITKQHLVENNSYKIKTYEGTLEFTQEFCKVKGNITEDGPKGKVKLDTSYFELDFTTELWNGSYLEGNNKSVDLQAYIRFRDLFYTGIAMSNKGFSLIRGLETNNKTKLVQIYIEQDIKKEKNFYNIIGIKDTIANKFEGMVKNSKLENDPKIVFELKGNPQKNVPY